MRFRDAPPLFFDLRDDPGEQRDLLRRPLTEASATALAALIPCAHALDFVAAERKRIETDEPELYSLRQILPPSHGNQFLLADGRLIDADIELYEPRVLAATPIEAFSDGPVQNVNAGSKLGNRAGAHSGHLTA